MTTPKEKDPPTGTDKSSHQSEDQRWAPLPAFTTKNFAGEPIMRQVSHLLKDGDAQQF